MKSLAEKIEVMQAALKGAEIEFKDDDLIWQHANYPQWDWFNSDYRIKPENKQVPFSIEDFEERFGKKFKHSTHNVTGLLTGIENKTIAIGHKMYVVPFVIEHLEWYNELLNRWESCTKTVKQ
jgi:hypothetical protein